MEKLENIQLYGSATVGERGQVVIPKKARQECAVDPGDTLMVLGNRENGITFIKAENLEELTRYFNGTDRQEDSE